MKFTKSLKHTKSLKIPTVLPVKLSSTSYRRPKVLISDAETLDNIKKQLDLGIIEEWEKYKIINPNLSEEECRAKLERVNAEKLERQKMFA